MDPETRDPREHHPPSRGSMELAHTKATSPRHREPPIHQWTETPAIGRECGGKEITPTFDGEPKLTEEREQPKTQPDTKTGTQVLPIYILLEVYKKAGLSALQCLSISLCGYFLVLAPSSCVSFALASSFSQPPAEVKTSSLQELFWNKFQWTAQYIRQANPAHPPPVALHQVSRNFTRLCIVLPQPIMFPSSFGASCPGSSSISTSCQNKLVKLFSCLLNVILHVGQIRKENHDSPLPPGVETSRLHQPRLMPASPKPRPRHRPPALTPAPNNPHPHLERGPQTKEWST
ncbi:hypothetical protein ATANTOWER_021698, partial [Ataeniobius toweri]|nr:hypothetical protein [Ataeniobius toweri]